MGSYLSRDTLALSYRHQACSGPGEVAAAAERIRIIKYAYLGQVYQFVLMAIETLDVYDPKTAVFVKELENRGQVNREHPAT